MSFTAARTSSGEQHHKSGDKGHDMLAEDNHMKRNALTSEAQSVEHRLAVLPQLQDDRAPLHQELAQLHSSKTTLPHPFKQQIHISQQVHTKTDQMVGIIPGVPVMYDSVIISFFLLYSASAFCKSK